MKKSEFLTTVVHYDNQDKFLKKNRLVLWINNQCICQLKIDPLRYSYALLIIVGIKFQHILYQINVPNSSIIIKSYFKKSSYEWI